MTNQWLEETAKKRGITVEQLRTEMSQRSKMADKSKSGFAVMDPNKHKKLASKGGKGLWVNIRAGKLGGKDAENREGES